MDRWRRQAPTLLFLGSLVFALPASAGGFTEERWPRLGIPASGEDIWEHLGEDVLRRIGSREIAYFKEGCDTDVISTPFRDANIDTCWRLKAQSSLSDLLPQNLQLKVVATPPLRVGWRQIRISAAIPVSGSLVYEVVAVGKATVRFRATLNLTLILEPLENPALQEQRLTRTALWKKQIEHLAIRPDIETLARGRIGSAVNATLDSVAESLREGIELQLGADVDATPVPPLRVQLNGADIVE